MKMGISAGSMFAIPSVSLAKQLENNRDKEFFKVDAGEDRFAKPINLFEGRHVLGMGRNDKSSAPAHIAELWITLRAGRA